MLQVHFLIIIIVLISLHQRKISALIISSINFDPIQEKMTHDTPELIDIGDDISLRIVRWGNPEVLNGRPILVVHGLASNALLWKGSALALVNLGHPVIGVDLRGHGPFSSKPDDEYDMVTVTNDISRLLLVLKEKEGFKKPIVLGQSWGGNLVVELAHKYPQLVDGIVGVDGGFLELSTRYPTWAECEIALKPPNVIGKSIHEIREYFIRSHPDWPFSSLEGMLANFEISEDETIKPWLTYDRHLKILKGLYEHHPSSIYDEVTVPVLFIPAEGGRNYEEKKRLVDKSLIMIRNVKISWMKADHDLHAQKPIEFANEVHQWILTL